ncbi:MAG: hypothetical protein OXG92_14945, partial [Chloroflexi bacterium]|nr:hypothetical protein [Chloroflexota bacterium]
SGGLKGASHRLVPTPNLCASVTNLFDAIALPVSFCSLDALAQPVLHSRHAKTQREHHAYADARPSWGQTLMAAPGNWQHFR